ncbi:hypothetical protein [Cryobacterium sp. SO1]|uniref:hypothetical protein n=1 Tax=Cryobacterium sp. SO1 TaxID=1897061 RepID=UPI001022E418|nr:hypothetical protein [Cryobacterium sp. SO1]
MPVPAADDWRDWATILVVSSLGPPDGDAIGPESAELEEMATGAVSTLAEFAAGIGPSNRIIAAVGVAGRTPIPVHVAVAAFDPLAPTDLLAVCGATGGTAMDPPDVEYPEFDSGDALRVTRVDLDSDGVAWASIVLALRTELADVVLTWRTTDLALLPLMPDVLDELIGTIHVQEEHT